MRARFDYAQAEEIRDAFSRHGVRYLFLGKSGAILLGFPDTTQDADLFVEKDSATAAPSSSSSPCALEGFPVCHIDDIIASKATTGPVKDRESLPRLRAFRDYRIRQPR
jgi:hypothetical protein